MLSCSNDNPKYLSAHPVNVLFRSFYKSERNLPLGILLQFSPSLDSSSVRTPVFWSHTGPLSNMRDSSSLFVQTRQRTAGQRHLQSDDACGWLRCALATTDHGLLQRDCSRYYAKNRWYDLRSAFYRSIAQFHNLPDQVMVREVLVVSPLVDPSSSRRFLCILCHQ